MSATTEDRPLAAARMQKAAAGFQQFCEKEFEWRRNGDEPFDEAAYRAAMQMVLDKLSGLTAQN
jgi:hypothetical protein